MPHSLSTAGTPPRGRPGRRLRAVAEPGRLALGVLYVLWALTLFDPHRWLGHVGISPAKHGLSLWYVVVVLVTAAKLPSILSRFRKEMVYPPLLAFLVAVALSVPFAIYVGKARDVLQIVFFYYLLVVVTLMLIRHPRQLIPILVMLPLQYAWWGLHGQVRGLIKWHHILGNYNGYGALMVMGIAVCFYFAFAMKSRLWRAVCFATAAYAVLGVVTSYARGAFLAAALVALVIWLRSPRKLLTSFAGVVGVVLVIGGSSMFVTKGNYFEEIASAFEDGTDSGTGAHRWYLWQSAFRMIGENPVVGVGGGNFGVYVVEHYGYQSVPGYRSASKLWNRDLHNIYIQVLAEFGLLGAIPFAWMILDFFKRNRALRRPLFLQAWKSSTGGRLDLRHVSLGLEGAMIGFLATGVMYGQLFQHWFFSLLALNLALYWSLRREIQATPRRPRIARAPARAAVVLPDPITAARVP